MLDFKQLNLRALGQIESLLKSWLSGGVISGGEYKAINPVRGDKTLGSFSVNISTGKWADFSPAAGGASGGDIISLYAYLNNCDNGEAYKHVSKIIGDVPARALARTTDTDWKLLFPIPDNAPEPFDCRKIKTGDTWNEYKITLRWTYHSITGAPMFHVCRYETPTGKEVLPLTLYKNLSGAMKWRWKSYPDPRPIYNLHLLYKHPAAQVIIVEGEKCADALQSIIESSHKEDKLVSITWQGGGKAIHKSDWSVLSGRRCVLWPDFDLKNDADGKLLPESDQPGYSCMVKIIKILLSAPGAKSEDLKFIKPVVGKPDGWDVADAILDDGWGLADVIKFIKENKSDIPVEAEPEPMPEEPANTDSGEFVIDDIPPDADSERASNNGHQPFRCLGYSGATNYYLPEGKQTILEMKDSQHNRGFLTALAPISYWEQHFPGAKSGCDWDSAIDSVLRASEAARPYDPLRLRGRGAWYDSGRVVLHLGDRLIVDNQETEIHKIESKYIYEALPTIELTRAEPISAFESYKIREILSSISWERPVYSTYTAGWIMIAPVCGALKWRPHLWVTGPAGSGKTFVLENIIRPCLGKTNFSALSSTSAAGIRQGLDIDSRPVTFDEFDIDSQKGAFRIQEVLELARQASSETDAGIYKGSQSGKAVRYIIRSSFLMSSIGVNIGQHADETRITVVSLRRNYNREAFAELNRKITDLLTPEWCAGLRARAVKFIPVIRKNAETFAVAITGKLGSRRSGDQLGALLAGAYALTSDKLITMEAAEEWINKQDWSEQQLIADGGGDERRCLDSIMTYTVSVTPSRKQTISELLEEVHKINTAVVNEPEFDTSDAAQILSRHGIRLDSDEALIYISDSHNAIKKILDDTAYAKSWARLLQRINGAVRKGSWRFTGCTTRATGIPWNEVFLPEKTDGGTAN